MKGLKQWLNTDSDMPIKIWTDKYQFNGESFEEWLDRISGGNEPLKRLVQEKKFLFGGRILSNRGLDKQGRKVTYSNCYVLEPPKDNIESIYDTCKQLARTFSYGGGVGIDISRLRPRGSKVNNSAKETTGAVSFMSTYSQVTETIGQNGRRGALMISIDVSHPDVEEFIDIKTDLEQVTKANISIKITEGFMKAVRLKAKYLCTFTVEDTGEVITKEVDAYKLFHKLAKNNWDFAEPGMLYWDRISNWNLLSEYEDFSYAGVNPCAEEPLPAGGSCLLGSMNLSTYVVNKFEDDAYFDFEAFEKDVEVCVRALNEVLDEGLPLHPLDIQKETVRDYRQIGLGVMGIADMLIYLKVRYGSKESLEICEAIAKTLLNSALKSSVVLAYEDGTFPKYDQNATLNAPFLKANADYEVIEGINKFGLRNSQLLTIAPTGSISTMLGISGGIEPMFDLQYWRKTESLEGGERYFQVVTPIVQEYMDKFNITKLEDLPNFFVTAPQLNYKERVDMQSVWQNYIDASISSTVNLSNEATIEDVEDIYMYAYEKGLKGITVYRDGCKRSGILVTSKEDDNKEEVLARGELKDIAEDTVYHRRPVNIGCGSLHLYIGYSESEKSVQDLIIKKSDGGGCEKNIETTVMGISMILRLGGTLEMIDKQFNSISTCASFTRTRERKLPISKGNCCGNAIMHVIKDFLKGEKVEVKEVKPQPKIEEKQQESGKCPECKANLQFSQGCITCTACGYSKCD